MRRKGNLYFECEAEGWQHHLSEKWGPCRRWIEVLDDQKAARQVSVYSNGYVLKYDRSRPEDDYGCLIGLRFSLKPKWRIHFRDVRLRTAEEFERVWLRTQALVS